MVLKYIHGYFFLSWDNVLTPPRRMPKKGGVEKGGAAGKGGAAKGGAAGKGGKSASKGGKGGAAAGAGPLEVSWLERWSV